MITRAIFNRAPLTPNRMAALPLGAIKPQGWLREQLETAAKGLSGRLHEFWADVRDSAWRGKDGNAWERAPYYLDGLVPLAYLLEDEELIGVCEEYIEWTLSSQRPDGFFGPEKQKDWWPRMIMLKVLMQYFTATADRRVPEFMFNYFKYQYKMLEKQPLRSWAVARCAENMQAIIWLYNLTGSKFLLDLLKKFNEQAIDWTVQFSSFQHTRPLGHLISWQEMKAGLYAEKEEFDGFEHTYYTTQYHLTHAVNVAMGLKAPGIISQFKSGRREMEAFHSGYQRLMKYHGLAHGMFSGDEHLNGNSPAQGTELCAIVEMMSTVETLLTTGIRPDGLGDILEKLAFNALPGALSGDMMAHQYHQQVNQVLASKAPRGWYNSGEESNVFGLEPNYGCCTANMNQGFPKYAASLWYATDDDGFAAVSYAPCKVLFKSGKASVRLTVDTQYPFGDIVRIRVNMSEDKKMPIRLRIPEWAEAATVAVGDEEAKSAEAGTYFLIDREWKNGEVITLKLPMRPRITKWGRKSAAVEVGSLLMAFHPQENWKKIKEHPIAPDWEVSTEDAWNWSLFKDCELKLDMTQAKGAPFSCDHGFVVRAQAAKLDEWKMDGASCSAPPVDPDISSCTAEEIELVPYGDTCLRIAQFPYSMHGTPKK